MKWKLFTPGAYTGQISFRGKMGLYRTLRSDETVFALIAPGEENRNVAEKVLGRKAWRFPANKKTRALLDGWLKELNSGTDSEEVLNEIETYWKED